MNPNAEVIGITDKGEYQDIYDCEEEYTSLVTISLKNNVKIYGE